MNHNQKSFIETIASDYRLCNETVKDCYLNNYNNNELNEDEFYDELEEYLN